MHIFLIVYLLLLAEACHASVIFDGEKKLIPVAEWRMLDTELSPLPEYLAKHLDDYRWVLAESYNDIAGSDTVLLRLDVHVSYRGGQHPLLLIPYSFIPNMTVGVLAGGKVLMWESLETGRQFVDEHAGRPTSMVSLPISRPGDYQILIQGSSVANAVIVRGTSLYLDNEYRTREYPAGVSIASVIVGALSTYLLFCFFVIIYRFRMGLLFAICFLTGAFGVILLREGILFLHWGVDVSWWVTHILPALMGLANFGILLYAYYEIAPFGWRVIRNLVAICGWSTLAVALLSIVIPIREHPGLSLFGLGVTVTGFLIALGLLAARAWRGGLGDRLFAFFVGSYMAVTLYRVAIPVFTPFPYVSVMPVYMAVNCVGVYVFVSNLLVMIREYVDEMARKSAALSRIDLVNRFSHELRTPLNAVIGLADLMQHSGDRERISSYANMIQNAGHTLLGLVDDILDFSRLGTTEVALARQPLRLDRLLTDVLSGFIPRVMETNVLTAMELDPELPFFLIGDELRLKQVFGNLINNAIKFSRPGGRVTVKVRPGQTDGDRLELLCSVQDTGRGIPADKLATIFEPYTQTQAEDAGHLRGTGLGLAICKLLVEQMQGEITVESEAGRGSTFYFNLWLRVDPRAPDLKQLYAPLKDKEVLVVSEQLPSLVALPAHLSYWGARATLVPACMAAPDKHYDLVMVDAVYIALSESTAWINRQPPGTVIEIVQVQSQPWRKQVTHANAHAFFVPVPVLSLLGTLVEHLTGEKVALSMGGEGRPELKEHRHNVLLVDDNIINLTVAGKLLASLSVPCDKVQGGLKALEELQSERRHSLVLLDCEMPDINGFEVSRRWRAYEVEQGLPRMPIIALTAHALDEVYQACLDAGMDEVLYKPIGRKAIIELLNRYPGL